MDTLELLLNRRSKKKLVAPAPSADQLTQIFQAALRTPDHGRLNPYRFVVIEKENLQKLEKLLRQDAETQQFDEKQISKISGICAKPMIIAVIAKITPNLEKVPEWEQVVTAGCAAYGIQLATKNMGFDNVWITGKWVNGTALRQALQCEAQDQIVALLMIGTAEDGSIERELKAVNVADFVSYL